MMTTFLDLLRESVIVQAVLTLMVWGSICYLYIVGQPVPDVLVAAGSAILGFYFGTKAQVSLYKSNSIGRK